MTVLAETAAVPAGLGSAAYWVSYIAAEGAEHEMPLAEAAAARFEQAMPVRRFLSAGGSGI